MGGYPIPPEALSNHIAILGKTGSGKSNAAKTLAEQALDRAERVCVLDPTGTWYGLRLTRRGKPSAYKPVIFGGRHGDLPVGGAHGAAIAETVGTTSTPAIIDTRLMTVADRTRFFTDFAEALLRTNQGPLTLIIDEAHLLAPHLAASSRDAETRRLGVATLTELCSRGRKRGIAPIIATQRLAKLAGSVVSELHNGLIGINVFDRDVARAADFLGFSAGEGAERLRTLRPGEFYAFGPALSRVPVLGMIGPTVTRHLGATPDLVGPSDAAGEQAAQLLDLDALKEVGGSKARELGGRGGGRLLDAFLMDEAAPAAVRIIAALRTIAPNATTAEDLARHLGLGADDIDAGLDLLSQLGAADTMPRGGSRIARLSARLRLRAIDAPVVGLA